MEQHIPMAAGIAEQQVSEQQRMRKALAHTLACGERETETVLSETKTENGTKQERRF